MFETLFIVGRILFALIFLASGVNHLKQADGMAGYAASKGVPAAKLSVIASGLIMIVGAALLIVGYYADLGALLLVIFLVPAAFLMHPFWKETDAMAKMNEQIAFMKDLSLAGAALVILALLQSVSVSNLFF